MEDRIKDPRKVWKLSPMDLASYRRRYDYSRARDDMFKVTHTEWAPWHLANSDDKRSARLNVIRHFLSSIPYKPIDRDTVKLPKRQKAHGYREPGISVKRVPEQAWGDCSSPLRNYPGAGWADQDSRLNYIVAVALRTIFLPH
jgi:hypothetical protein